MFKKKKPENRILMLIDFENLQKNTELPLSPETTSFIDGFDRLIKEITRENGEIVDAFVFAPSHLADFWTRHVFKELGFYTMLCPKVKTKEEKEEDTVDSTMIEFGKKRIRDMTDLTHLCLGTGDKDFNPLVREAIRKKLKIIVVAGSEKSLASKLIKLADRIYLFSPTETKS